MPLTLQNLIDASMRKAGLSKLPGTGPGIDKYTEAIGAMNRMMGSMNITGSLIYKTSIDRYALTPQQTTYFIGPTGDFVTTRPLYISRANIVITSTSPELHEPLWIYRSAAEWAAVVMPETPAPWPWAIYNDGAAPDSKLYLYGYPTEANDLELFTWQEILPEFTSISDLVVLPSGYQAHIVNAFTEELESLYPLQAKVSPVTRQLVAQSRRAIQVLNAVSPKLVSDADNLNSSNRGSDYDQKIGFLSGWQA